MIEEHDVEAGVQVEEDSLLLLLLMMMIQLLTCW